MNKKDNYGNFETIFYFLCGVTSLILWAKNYGIECLIGGLFFIILAYISMAIITIKKYIDKVFEDKVRNIDHANIYMTKTLKVLKNEEEVKEND